MNLSEVFEKYNDDGCEFQDVTERLSTRPDLCAFLILERLFPNRAVDIVAAAEHDEFYIGVNPEELASVATEEDIRNLIRCGVLYDVRNDGLSMFT